MHDAIRASRWNRTAGAQTAQGCKNKVVLGASWWGVHHLRQQGRQATPSRGLWKLAHFLSKASNPPNTPSLNHGVGGTSTPIRLISGLAKRNKLKMPSPKGATRRLLESGTHTNPSPGMRIPRANYVELLLRGKRHQVPCCVLSKPTHQLSLLPLRE